MWIIGRPGISLSGLRKAVCFTSKVASRAAVRVYWKSSWSVSRSMWCCRLYTQEYLSAWLTV